MPEPETSTTTLAGTGVMNVYHAPSRRNVVIDFLDQAGSGAHADMFADASPGAAESAARALDRL